MGVEDDLTLGAGHIIIQIMYHRNEHLKPL